MRNIHKTFMLCFVVFCTLQCIYTKDEYNCYGIGREADGSSEYQPIFWKIQVFDEVERGMCLLFFVTSRMLLVE